MQIGSSESLVQKIVRLPEKLQVSNDASMFTLLKQSGYFEAPGNVEESEIEAALVKEPNYISNWLQYSADKRTSDGWYIIERNGSDWQVGNICANHIQQHHEFRNVQAAVAFFIVREIEDVRNS